MKFTIVDERIKDRVFGKIGEKFGYITETKARSFYRRLTFCKSIKNTDVQIINSPKDAERYVYILRLSYPLNGIGAVIKHLLTFDSNQIWKNKEWSVLVDYRGYSELAKYPYSFSDDSLFERYFVQPPISSIPEILDKTFVAVSPLNASGIHEGEELKEFNLAISESYCRNGDEGNKIRNILKPRAQTLLRFQQEIVAEFNEEKRRILDDSKRTIGVLMREEFSDEHLNEMRDNTHKAFVVKYHTHNPSVDDIIKIVKQKLDEWGADVVFVSSLYSETIQKFKDILGIEKVVFIERERLSDYSMDALDGCLSSYDQKKFETTNYDGSILEQELYIERMDTYMKELYLLSRCDCFISGKSSGGMIVPLIKNGDFSHVLYY